MRTLHVKTSNLCEKLFKLEREGRYEEAVSEIGDVWQDKTELPNVEGLAPHLTAELILRCGSLFGFLGHNKQIPNSQEKSRNLLTHARSLFIELYDVEKIAECENYLALAYWRTGEINEVETWLEESFSHNLPVHSDARLYANVIKSLLCLSTGKFDEIISDHKKLIDDFFKYADNFLKGSFCTNVGAAFEKTGHTAKALEFLQKAHQFHLKSRHKIYLGTVQNNISQIYKLKKEFSDAHQFIDRAVHIFRKIKDRTREGFSLDTKADIYLSEGKYEEALETIEKAITILKSGENAAYLIETYRTKIQILISMDNVSAATFCLIEAVQIARAQISEEQANSLVRQFEISVREHLTVSKNLSARAPGGGTRTETAHGADVKKRDVFFDGIELILPSPLSNFEDFQGIWINNTHLEKVGLVKDSLAVVVPADDIRRGDLVAIEETENQNVSCGFYDNEFGIVCLEGQDSEPLLFDEEKIKIIGKIVGVGIKRTADGKLIVEQLFQ